MGASRARCLIATVLLGLLIVPTLISAQTRALAADNPIVTENAQPGTSNWIVGSKLADDTTGQVKGYASATSVLQGQNITLYVSVNPAQTYTIDFYRIGWYGGLGGRLRLDVPGLTGAPQLPCVPDANTGLIACNWQPSYTLAIPSDWTSGVYVALLTNSQGYQSYVIFVVRDGRPAPFLYQQSVTTYEAYNNYPNDGVTGKSLYTDNSYGANTIAGDPRAVKVSFDRPYAGAGPSGSFNGSAQFFWFEVYFVRWLERNGYDVTYSTDVDTHANGGELKNHRAFLSVAHDEYWSMDMFNAASAARDAGVNLGFFTANAAFWQVRFEPSGAGVPNRVVVCYKNASIDPVQGPTTTVNFRDPLVNLPEQTLEGVQFTSATVFASAVPYVVTNSSSWVYAGTGFKDGDTVPGIVGYEMDRWMSNYPSPSSISRTQLSQSPFTNTGGGADYANSSIYQAPSGAWVFAAGTIEWSWGLDNTLGHNAADPRIQQTTANLLNAFLNGAPVVHDLKVATPASASSGQAFTVTVTAENFPQGNPVPGYSGTVHFSSSDTATGVVLPPDSTLTNGQGTFSVTLITAGSQTLTVSDTANSLSTTVTVAVNGLVHDLKVTAPGAATAGQAFTMTVAAEDALGNPVRTYTGTVHFSSSDTSPGVVLPPDSTLTNGQGTFSATLDRAGSQTIGATDTVNATITGSVTVQVTAASAATLRLTAPASAKATQAFSVTVTLTDRFGNVATGYTGTVHFSSSDMLAQTLGDLPHDYTFTGGDAGTHTFSVTLATVGNQTITVADTANGALSATSPPIAVSLV